MKVVVNNVEVWTSNELPLKDQKILVEQLDGTYSIQKATKNYTHRDCFVESTRMVFPIVKIKKIKN
jgi:hypothetical protein